MSILDEFAAIETRIMSAYPTTSVVKQTVPEKPAPNSFCIRLMNDDRVTETRMTTLQTREYQIVYFAPWPEDVIPVMAGLSAALYQSETIGPGIRMSSFGYASPFRYKSGDIHASIGALTVNVREVRVQPTSQVVGQIHIRQSIGPA